MIRTISFCVAALMCVSNSATAREMHVLGLGSDSCANLSLALQSSTPTKAIVFRDSGETYFTKANAYSQWISGFVTAHTYTMNRVITTDMNGLVLSVNKTCEDDPSLPIVGAVLRIIERESKP